MRLSDAILLGALDGKQLFNELANLNGDTCAIGAAIKAAGLWVRVSNGWRSNTAEVQKEFPVLMQEIEPCHCGEDNWGYNDKLVVWDRIVHLNNHHRMTRQEIAAWVRSIEPADDPRPAAQPETTETVHV